ncbi:HAD family hydrolase [Actinoplanes sp. NPDC051494]|uniref:HAD family hydrolase n=1 Tax=Actinoplanes sp. NPDC051494 TaxID=3363907 RepID=UPI0037AB7B0C
MSVRFPVIAFDLDGTLLRGTSASLVIARSMGTLAAVEELERAYTAYEIDNVEFATREARLFAGLTADDIRHHLRDAPWIGGVAETLDTLAEQGAQLLLATLAWTFAGEQLPHAYRFAALSGARMEYVDGRLTGRVGAHISEDGKLDFVEQWCAEHGYKLGDVAAVGDSRSDVPLFRAAGTAVAINASEAARQAAGHFVDTEDLRDVLPFLLAD